MKCLLVACLAAFLALPSTAEAQVPTQRQEEAAHLAAQGLASSLRGEFEAASGLYRQAFALDPAPEYLYSAARSEHQAGQCQVAIADYATLLGLPTVPTSLRVKSEFHLTDARSALAENRCVPAQSKPPSRARAHAAFALIGVGGAALLSSALVWVQARNDQHALDGYRNPTTGQFRPDLIGPTPARDVQASINARTIAAWTLLGVGVGSGGVATWLLATDKAVAPQVSVGPQGIVIAGQF